MQEIKFRAWHHGHGYSSPFGIGGHPEWDGVTVSYFPQVCEFEQFTGLQDKNGKDIYEGDIMKSTNRDEHFDTVNETEKVELVRDLDHYISAMNWIPVHGEIIGNVHQTPVLLK